MVTDTLIPRLLRATEVFELVGMGRSTVYRRIADGTFPRPVAVGGGSVRWREDHLREWLESLPETSE